MARLAGEEAVEFVPAGGRAASGGGWPELVVEDPRRLGLARPIPRTIRLDTEAGEPMLRYGSAYEGSAPYRCAPEKATALTEFATLADRPDSDFPNAVLEFARRWGPLELCEHGIPRFHPSAGRHSDPRPVQGKERGSEAVAPWRRFTRSAAATLSILSDLTEAMGVGTVEAWWNADWRRRPWEAACTDRSRINEQGGAFVSLSPLPGTFEGEAWPPRVPETIPDAAFWLTACVSNWVKVAGAALELRPLEGLTNGRPQWAASLSLGSLPGQLAGELVALLVSGRGAFRCVSCGRPYTVPVDGRHRSPSLRVDRRGHFRSHFCPTCGAAAAKRLWEREHAAERNRSRAEARKRAKGAPEIGGGAALRGDNL